MPPGKRLSEKTADELLRAMMVLARTVSHVLETRVLEATREPLTGSKLQLLHLLGQRGPQTPTQVARFLGVTKPAVTQAVDAMIESGFVQREASKEDRRGSILELTARGSEVFRKVRNEQRHLIRNALRETDVDPEAWVEVLHEMSVSLAKSDQAFKHFCVQCGAYADGNCVLVGGDVSCLFLRHRGATPRRGKRSVSK